MGKPARANDHRLGNARRHSQHLYAQGRTGERRALEHRVRDRGECQRPGQGGAEIARGEADAVRSGQEQPAWKVRFGTKQTANCARRCPLVEAKRTWLKVAVMSAYDPKRTAILQR